MPDVSRVMVNRPTHNGYAVVTIGPRGSGDYYAVRPEINDNINSGHYLDNRLIKPSGYM